MSNFEGILFTLIRYTEEVAMLQDPWRSGFLCGAKMTPSPPKLLKQHRLICQNIATAYFSLSWLIWFRHSPLRLSLALESTVGWISTLAYGTNTNCWPGRFPVVYCTHTVQTKLTLKNWRFPQKSMFIATGGPIDVRFAVLEYSVGVVGQ